MKPTTAKQMRLLNTVNKTDFYSDSRATYNLIVDMRHGRARVEADYSCHNGRSHYRRYGMERAYPLPTIVDATKLEAYYNDCLLPIVAQMLAGYSEFCPRWGDGQLKGEMDESSYEAEERLVNALAEAPTVSGEYAGVWEASDLLRDADLDHLELSDRTTEDELWAAAETVIEEALAEGIKVDFDDVLAEFSQIVKALGESGEA